MREYRKQTADERVEEILQESRARREQARLMLEDWRDISEAWVITRAATAEVQQKLDEIAEMIREGVREDWGAGATVEFETQPKRRVVAVHRDGRRLVLATQVTT